MEPVILRSDIARLVLRYLQDEKLESVSLLFCESSPHLKKELLAYQQGLVAYSFFPALEELISEYVKILQSVNEYLSSMPDKQTKLRYSLLSEKVNAIIRNCVKDNDFQNSSTAPLETNVNNSKTFKRKRKASASSFESTPVTEHSKRRRFNAEEYYFLSTKNGNKNTIESSVEETSDSNDEHNEDTAVDCTANGSVISRLETPRSESTPRNNFPKLRIEKEISQVILDNPDFQKKLVNNINEALNTAEAKCNENSTKTTLPQELDEIQTLTPCQLDEMVKNILEATERDPTFDAIIEEVVGVPDPQSNAVNAPECQKNVPAMVPSTSNPQLQLMSTSRSIAQPRTPLIIRNAIAAITAPGDSNAVPTDDLPQLGANHSFGMYTDPSIALSKLVVLNSNDSAQKNCQVDQTTLSIGNSTADHILSHLTNGTESVAATNCDQVLFDMSNGQLTFPVLLRDDGSIAPIYCLSNNESHITTQMDGNQFGAPTIVIPAQAAGKINVTPTVQIANNKIETIPAKEIITVPKNVGPAQNATAVQIEHDSTPSGSNVVASKITKSLSTPRRRSTHVRTLTFSPASSAAPLATSGATPHSTRRNLPTSKVFNISTLAEETAANTSMEKPIIRNIEILPQLTTLSSVVSNDSSNSCNVPPLFAGEESSNQTVIKTDKSLIELSSGSEALRKLAATNSSERVEQKSISTVEDDTPKRKQSRRTAVRRCKRQLSKSSNEEETQPEKVLNTTKRSIETNNKVQAAITNKNQTKAKETDEALLEDDPKAVVTLEDWKRLRSVTNSDLDARLREINANRVGVMPKREKKKVRTKRKEVTQPKDSATMKRESNILAKQHLVESNTNVTDRIEITIQKSDSVKQHLQVVAQSATLVEQSNQAKPIEHLAGTVAEVQRRTANIGYLLETPFKNSSENASGVSFVPPTPGVFLPTLDTPNSKSKEYDELRESASFLFGSLSKSELGTPLLSAITPGLRFTPHLAKDTNTPRSVATTEYSSGGSYYRPDESEDVDQNFDRTTHESVNKEQCSERSQQKNYPPSSLPTASHEAESDICVEIPVQMLKVEPLVLRRVKSFGQEKTEGEENVITAVDPHYTFAQGLPDICAENEEDLSKASLSSSSSSSSSSTSCSSSSSDTSSSSDSENEHADLKNVAQSARPISRSSDNYSQISSAEDEDWEKLELETRKPVALQDEASNLIDKQTGEVRYPVRSWLTPRKPEDPLVAAQVIKVTLKSAEKNNRHAELAMKRERVKMKLEQDKASKMKPIIRRPNLLNTTKSQKKIQVSKEFDSSAQKVDKEKAIETVDVLTALQLSAKKPSQAKISSTNALNATPTKLPPPGEVDDNAVSNIFPASTTTLKTLFPPMVSPRPNLASRSQSKIESQIEPIKSASKSKQIVRTPLGFKGTTVRNNNTTKTVQKKVSPKPKKKVSSSTTTRTIVATENTRVSPRVQSIEKPKRKALIQPKKTPVKLKRGKIDKKMEHQKKEIPEKKKSVVKTLKSCADDSIMAVKAAPQVERVNAQNVAKIIVDNKQKNNNKRRSNESGVLKKIEKSPNDPKAFSNLPSVTTQESLDSMAIESNKAAERRVDLDDYEDDDPLADCVRVTFDENDRESYFTIVHDSQQSENLELALSTREKIAEDLCKFELKFAFDEGTTHTCRISENFTFFEQNPSFNASETSLSISARNLPKKRAKVISSCSKNFKGNPINTSTDSKIVQIENKLNKSQNTTQTSLEQTRISSIVPVFISNSTLAPANKIQIGDIESILSKIHDAGT